LVPAEGPRGRSLNTGNGGVAPFPAVDETAIKLPGSVELGGSLTIANGSSPGLFGHPVMGGPGISKIIGSKVKSQLVESNACGRQLGYFIEDDELDLITVDLNGDVVAA
jgi:hypothetical protein